jgi:hypothetical protein
MEAAPSSAYMGGEVRGNEKSARQRRKVELA